jgi:hypothetical protein
MYINCFLLFQKFFHDTPIINRDTSKVFYRAVVNVKFFFSRKTREDKAAELYRKHMKGLQMESCTFSTTGNQVGKLILSYYNY